MQSLRAWTYFMHNQTLFLFSFQVPRLAKKMHFYTRCSLANNKMPNLPERNNVCESEFFIANVNTICRNICRNKISWNSIIFPRCFVYASLSYVECSGNVRSIASIAFCILSMLRQIQTFPLLFSTGFSNKLCYLKLTATWIVHGYMLSGYYDNSVQHHVMHEKKSVRRRCVNIYKKRISHCLIVSMFGCCCIWAHVVASCHRMQRHFSHFFMLFEIKKICVNHATTDKKIIVTAV